MAAEGAAGGLAAVTGPGAGGLALPPPEGRPRGAASAGRLDGASGAAAAGGGAAAAGACATAATNIQEGPCQRSWE